MNDNGTDNQPPWPVLRSAGAAHPFDTNAIQDALVRGYQGCEFFVRGDLVESITSVGLENFGNESVGASLAIRCILKLTDEATVTLAPALYQLADAGVSVLNVSFNFVGSASRTESAGRMQGQMNSIHRVLRSLLFDAEATGIRLAIEANCDQLFGDPLQLREFIDAIPSWTIGVCLDETTFESAAQFQDWMITLTRRIHAIRLASRNQPDSSRAATATIWPTPMSPAELRDILESIRFQGVIIHAPRIQPTGA